jgi:hypothetical protein
MHEVEFLVFEYDGLAAGPAAVVKDSSPFVSNPPAMLKVEPREQGTPCMVSTILLRSAKHDLKDDEVKGFGYVHGSGPLRRRSPISMPIR